MIETIVLALIFSRIKGYKIKKILKCYSLYPIVLFEIIHVILQIQISTGNYSNITLARSYKTFYMYLFLIPIFKYKEYIQGFIGSLFIFLGTLLNNLVIYINGGRMPVFPSLSYYTGYVNSQSLDAFKSIYFLGDSSTKFKMLSDWIDVGYSVLSIGDILIRVFVFIIIYTTIIKINIAKENQLVNI